MEEAVQEGLEEVAEVAFQTVTVTTKTKSIGLAQLILLLFFVLAAAYYVTKHVLGGGKSRTLTVLVGPSGSGKTTLFKQVRPPSV